ncbi:hypothetical protein GQ53DRAFT_239913 [Thozetella sp. PMI_491]|nr:hypothetical protein GQ53DRAFT_239913 [Thozetella sp. PMI_491]
MGGAGRKREPCSASTKPKRIITPARKEQNKLAQRAYRQRLKEQRESAQATRHKQEKPLRVLKPFPDSRLEPDSALQDVGAAHDELCLSLIQSFSATGVEVAASPDWQLVPLNSFNTTHADLDSGLTEDAPLDASFWLTSKIDNSAMDPDSPDADPQSYLPDLLMNNINLSRFTTYTAYFNNALSLYLNIPEILTPECVSRFYRPIGPGDDPKQVMASASDPSIPRHLQPTLPQVLFKHHPWIDLIPFPSLRARLIVMTSTMPHIFSLSEFKQDLYMKEALVCWRTRGDGQPWDMRSWEAQPWFLAKWKMLVDGEQGEIWKQSSWWRGLRSRVSEVT